MAKQIEIITRQALGDMLGMTKAGISHAVNHQKRLRDIPYGGQTGINLYDPLTFNYVAEVCQKKNIPLPPQFKKEKSDIQIFMEGVDSAWTTMIGKLEKKEIKNLEDYQDTFIDSIVDYFKRERGE